jgi:hypothetical protein
MMYITFCSAWEDAGARSEEYGFQEVCTDFDAAGVNGGIFVGFWIVTGG